MIFLSFRFFDRPRLRRLARRFLRDFLAAFFRWTFFLFLAAFDTWATLGTQGTQRAVMRSAMVRTSRRTPMSEGLGITRPTAAK